MELERTTALYFSPAGGTKKVTERIAQSLGARAESADVTVRARELEFGPAELVVIGAPVYGGRVPWPVGERLSRVSARGTPAVIAAVYGNRAYEDALLELRTLAEGRGFRVMAAGAFIARHSIVPEIAQGRPDAEDLVKIDEFSRRIRERLEYVASAESLPTAIVPGEREYRRYDGVPMHPEAARGDCVGCGRCAAECPVGAIPAAEPWKTDGTRCITCMRCVAVCPQFARHLSRLKLAAAKLSLKKACAQRREPELFI